MEHELYNTTETSHTSNVVVAETSALKVSTLPFEPSEPEISSRDESPEKECLRIDPSARDLEGRIFLSDALEKCRFSAHSYALAKSESDKAARESIIMIAETVRDNRFDLKNLEEILKIKLTKSQFKRPHYTLLRVVDPSRDPKVHSKLAIALTYALGQCNWQPELLREFFARKSIKQCLREYQKAKKDARGDATKKPVKMTLEGLPDSVRGEVILKLQICDRQAVVLELLPGPL